MHFSQINEAPGGKAGKFALVAGLHALLAVGAMSAMSSKTISLPALLEDQIVWMQPEIAPPPPPPQPPQPRASVSTPDIVVPKQELDTTPPPMDDLVQASTEADLAPQPALPSHNDAAPAPADAGSNPGVMGSAVLADADSCAKPAYPVNAARNGETGTVTLALMVGTDGRVQGSRVQQSSGSRELDRAAVNALSLCQFKPAMHAGAAQAGWAQIAYVWTLE
ncbi:energy transducer TonB [Massilia sp. H6]|uniref:energy transducer TonB n=1 Tax=Massilia sp. H6 TaxID=2970464 RepID=UPI00216870B1|nr:energy transducer TonB [Massilia sp. H6]UVW29030.1 TonB family protein [Massilia sp. H6]